MALGRMKWDSKAMLELLGRSAVGGGSNLVFSLASGSEKGSSAPNRFT